VCGVVLLLSVLNQAPQLLLGDDVADEHDVAEIMNGKNCLGFAPAAAMRRRRPWRRGEAGFR